jgi:hypothetical protein
MGRYRILVAFVVVLLFAAGMSTVAASTGNAKWTCYQIDRLKDVDGARRDDDAQAAKKSLSEIYPNAPSGTHLQLTWENDEPMLCIAE